ncbi:response regulator [Streptomyces gilvus]|uniref:response regulator n=1 Tax=Streptomyces gilvus TaxID=2920937 RepID=UPI001F0EA97D|nr:response regulator transcription factor [Streptomyces sp. CME 23]MCH5676854.1 response regulator transcription factor [Streptomyces sp. CME 23]
MNSPATRTPISVLIADDQALVRGAFGVLVDADPRMRVVAAAADGAQAVTLCAEHCPQVVLMDVRMPELDGVEATRRITTRDPAVKILMLTTFDLDEYVFGALRAGACGFLLKDTPPEELLNAIAVVADGEALLSPTVTRRLIEEFTRRPEPARGPLRSLDGLTDRERDVLLLIGRGLSNAEIADRLHLAAPTVKTHISRLLAKLQARDRAQLVIAAYESGLLDSA